MYIALDVAADETIVKTISEIDDVNFVTQIRKLEI